MDPREWTDRITERLFDYDVCRLKEEKTVLIQQNAKETGIFVGFLAGGRFFTDLDPTKLQGIRRTAVHPSLRQDALDWLDEEKLLEKEHMQVRQGLYQLLQHCKDLQDVRDAIPDALAKDHDDLAPLPRTREEAWPIAHSPLLMHSWETVSNTIFTRYSSALLN